MENRILGIADQPDLLLKSKRPAKHCSDQVLLKNNYLSEFFTKSDKEKVLRNLGILDIINNVTDTGYITEKELSKLLEDYLKKEKVGDKPEDIDNIVYDNEDYPDIKTLHDALDLLLYKELTITINISPQIAEKGTTVSPVVITWDYNKNVKSQTMYNSDYPGGISLDNDIRSLTVQGETKTDRSFKIVGSDGRKTVEGQVSINFYPGIYYGNGVEQPDMSNIKKTIRANRYCSVTVNAGTGEYIWIFLPQGYGNPTFTVGGFSGGFYKAGTAQRNGTDYNVWRSDNHSLGNTTINIS